MIDIKVPAIGESITEVTLVKWIKKDGDYVERDEVIAEFESEKATFEVNAEKAGVLKTKAAEGDTLNIGDVLAQIDETAQKSVDAGSIASQPAPVAQTQPNQPAVSEPAPTSAATPVAAGKGIIDIKVPTVGESITEVTLVKWLKKEGDLVQLDEVIAELESEKATFELNAEQAGKLSLKAKEGETLKIGDIIATIDSDVAVSASVSQPTAEAKPAAQAPSPASTPAQPAAQAPVTSIPNNLKATPVAAAIIADKKVEASAITASGFNGKIMKNDVLQALANPGKKAVAGQELFSRNERTEKMSNLRKTVSRRLVEAKNTTAMLTTFNEVDMSRIMALRTQFKDKFKEKHGTNLGFMSFFTKAVCYALQEWPSVNAYIDGDSIIYHDYCDISIAVSAPKGLVVPVIRNAESLSMAEIEKKVVELAGKARENKLSMAEMQGGTFTITNGGVFGSLMSTPIINIPQSAILGMHKIQERPMAVNGQVVVKPMMYLALSYDHRIIDGRESVSFLVRVKELLETPELLLFGKDPVKTLLEL
ncbi:2-oxoglutarate dehydrogenase complex dihydrolipoyllysine-residue succinyltransferase [Segetibacter koreensis]|uniref:2-oxoglutarate dehydrogenase complex dihydrolipoyllysine-residue succinyltransferase n=1 Tax=Segetibacter koreensis TaxID=398037 RepID=UPI00037DD2F5|nr:2-oxoglutarate dehydrogenase complex dihydrolipoyllysine-residue succinyltransferase [Segetibacter koreensis]